VLSSYTPRHWVSQCWNWSCVRTGQSLLVSVTHLRPVIILLLLSDSCRYVYMGRHLWRGDRSVVYNCCWASPAQSFSGPSPTGLSQIRDSPNLEGQVPVFMSPRNRMVRLCPLLLGPLFIVSYDLRAYGGGIEPTSTTYGNSDSASIWRPWPIFIFFPNYL
jgi:hypothetical protein